MKKGIIISFTLLFLCLSLGINFADAAAEKEAVLDQRILGLIKNAPTAKDFPGISVVYLLMEEKDMVNEDGTGTYTIHMVYKILDKQGVPLGEVNIPFNSDEAALNIDMARTITPDNKIVDVAKENIRELAPYSGFPIYSNVKLKQFSMPAMEVGSVIEYKATLTVFKPKMPGFFYSYWAFPPGLPVISSILEIDAPEKTNVKYASRNIAANPEVTTKDGRKVYRWTAKDIFIGGIFEPFLPPYNDVCPNLTFATEKKWDEVADWFYGISEPQTEPDEDMRNFTMSVMKRKGKDREKTMKELYNFVSKEIRYVSTSLKDSGYKPHKASEIYTNKYGDCKDKSALLISLYRIAGIEAYFALLKTRFEGSIIREFPAFDFNHCIVAVPKKDGGYLFLDPTLELNRFGYIPVDLQDVDIFVVKKDGYEFARLPLEREDVSSINLEINMNIGDDYVIAVDEKDEFLGDSEIMTRMNAKYSTPDATKAYLEQMLQNAYLNPRLIGYESSNPDELDEHFWIRFKYELSGQIKEAGNLLILDLPGTIALHMNVAVSTETRVYPIFFPELTNDSTVINIVIPKKCKINYLPSAATKNSVFGDYRREVSRSDNMVTLKYYYKSKMINIPAAQYNEFKTFIKDVIKSAKESIILEKI